MSDNSLTQSFAATVNKLSEPQSFKGLFHPHSDGNPLPSGAALEEIVALSRAILFPGYYHRLILTPCIIILVLMLSAFTICCASKYRLDCALWSVARRKIASVT